MVGFSQGIPFSVTEINPPVPPRFWPFILTWTLWFTRQLTGEIEVIIGANKKKNKIK